MNVVYDIRQQNPPNDTFPKILFIGVSVVLLIAFVLVLIRIIMCLTGKIHSSKISIVLDFAGLIFIPIIVSLFLKVDIGNDYIEACKSLEQNACLSITGKPTITRKYRPNGFIGKYPDGFVGEYVQFTIKDVSFDTYELYQSYGVGFTKEQVDAIEKAEHLTVKYYGSDTGNTILFIGTNQVTGSGCAQGECTGDGSLC